MTIGVLAVLAMLFVMFAGFWTDWLWYRSVQYSAVFTKTLWTKVGMFAVFGLLMAAVVGLNVWIAHRVRPPLSAMSLEQQSLDRYRMSVAPYKKWMLLGIAVLVGLIAGASAAGQWKTRQSTTRRSRRPRPRTAVAIVSDRFSTPAAPRSE